MLHSLSTKEFTAHDTTVPYRRFAYSNGIILKKELKHKTTVFIVLFIGHKLGIEA